MRICAAFADAREDLLQYRDGRLCGDLRRHALYRVAVRRQLLQLKTNRTQLFGYLTNQHHLVRTERDHFGEE